VQQEHAVNDNQLLRDLIRERISSLFHLYRYQYHTKDLLKYVEDFLLPSFIYYYYRDSVKDFRLFLNNITDNDERFLPVFKRVNNLLYSIQNEVNGSDVRILGDIHSSGSTKYLVNNKIRYQHYPYYNDIINNVLSIFLDNYKQYFPKISKDNFGNIVREYVDIDEKTDSESVVREYYHNLGKFIPGLLLLRSIDINAENMIIHLPYPIFFDMETVLSGEFDEAYSNYDIKNTGVVKVIDDIDSSLLSGGLKKNKSYLKPIIIGDINSPRIVWKVKSKGKYHNIPILNGKKALASNYVNDLMRGYKESYEKILLKKDDILNVVLLDSNFIRVIFRPTRVYRVITLESCYPQVYENSYIDDFLEKKLNEYQLIHNVDVKDLLSIELESINKLEIPVFYCSVKSRDIISPEGKIAAKFFNSPESYWKEFVSKNINKEFFVNQELILRNSIQEIK